MMLVYQIKILPFSIENTTQMEFSVTSSPHPLVHEDRHIFTSDCEDCLRKYVRADQHMRP